MEALLLFQTQIVCIIVYNSQKQTLAQLYYNKNNSIKDFMQIVCNKIYFHINTLQIQHMYLNRQRPNPIIKYQSANFDWLSHFYYMQKKGQNTASIITKIIADNFDKIGKVVIYVNSTTNVSSIQTQLQKLLELKSCQSNGIVIINHSHKPEQLKQRQLLFALDQSRILITTQEASKTFRAGVIDVQGVNLIIFESLPYFPTDYRAKVLRSNQLDPLCRGVVFTIINKYSQYSIAQKIQMLQKQLKIKVNQYQSPFTPLIMTLAKQTKKQRFRMKSAEPQNIKDSRWKDTTIRQDEQTIKKQNQDNDQKTIGPISSKSCYNINIRDSIKLNVQKQAQQQSSLNPGRRNSIQGQIQKSKNQQKTQKLNIKNDLVQQKKQSKLQKKQDLKRKQQKYYFARQDQFASAFTKKDNKNVQQFQIIKSQQYSKQSPNLKQPLIHKQKIKKQILSFNLAKANEVQKNSSFNQQSQNDLHIKKKQQLKSIPATKQVKSQGIIQKNQLSRPAAKENLLNLVQMKPTIKNQVEQKVGSQVQKATTCIINKDEGSHKNQVIIAQAEPFLAKQILNKLDAAQKNNKRMLDKIQQLETSFSNLKTKKQQDKEQRIQQLLSSKIQQSETKVKNLLLASTNELEKKLVEKLTIKNKDQVSVLTAQITKIKESIIINSNKANKEGKLQAKLESIISQNRQLKKEIMQIQESYKKLSQNLSNLQQSFILKQKSIKMQMQDNQTQAIMSKYQIFSNQIHKKLKLSQEGREKMQNQIQGIKNAFSLYISEKQKKGQPLGSATIDEIVRTSVAQMQKKLVATQIQITKLKQSLSQNVRRSNQQGTSIKSILAQNKQFKTDFKQAQQKIQKLVQVSNNLQLSQSRIQANISYANRQQQKQLQDKIGFLFQKHQQFSVELGSIKQNFQKLTKTFFDEKITAIKNENLQESLKACESNKNDQAITDTIVKKHQICEQQSQNMQQVEPVTMEMNQTAAKVQEKQNLKSTQINVFNAINFSIDSLKMQMQQFLKYNTKKEKFLVQSSIRQNMKDGQIQFLLNTVQKYSKNRRIANIKKIFEYNTDDSFQNVLQVLEKKPNVLMLVWLQNGHFIGGFSQGYFSSSKKKALNAQNDAKGCMMSITGEKIYELKQRYYGCPLRGDKYSIQFGNELRLSSNLEYDINFEISPKYFSTGGDTIQDFIGESNKKGNYQMIEFHQVYFE